MRRVEMPGTSSRSIAQPRIPPTRRASCCFVSFAQSFAPLLPLPLSYTRPVGLLFTINLPRFHLPVCFLCFTPMCLLHSQYGSFSLLDLPLLISEDLLAIKFPLLFSMKHSPSL
jgi:hypothetical protein